MLDIETAEEGLEVLIRVSATYGNGAAPGMPVVSLGTSRLETFGLRDESGERP